MTYWADFIAFDIAHSQDTGKILNNAILIPNDDNNYKDYNVKLEFKHLKELKKV